MLDFRRPKKKKSVCFKFIKMGGDNVFLLEENSILCMLSREGVIKKIENTGLERYTKEFHPLRWGQCYHRIMKIYDKRNDLKNAR